MYYILYKTLIGSKPLRTRFDKIDVIIRTCDGTRYLTLFASEKYDVISDKIRYFIKSKKQYKIYFFSLFCENQS